MTSTTRVVIDEKTTIEIVNEDVRAVFMRFGGKVRKRARNSMKPQTPLMIPDGEGGMKQKKVRGRNGAWRTVWKSDTPIGEPPRVREGFIKHYINAAMDGEAGVVIGPEALARHSTECLARLEYGDHPFMKPAFDAELPRLPQVWADVIGTR